jgi:hypothetical protein
VRDGPPLTQEEVDELNRQAVARVTGEYDAEWELPESEVEKIAREVFLEEWDEAIEERARIRPARWEVP